MSSWSSTTHHDTTQAQSIDKYSLLRRISLCRSHGHRWLLLCLTWHIFWRALNDLQSISGRGVKFEFIQLREIGILILYFCDSDYFSGFTLSTVTSNWIFRWISRNSWQFRFSCDAAVWICHFIETRQSGALSNFLARSSIIWRALTNSRFL